MIHALEAPPLPPSGVCTKVILQNTRSGRPPFPAIGCGTKVIPQNTRSGRPPPSRPFGVHRTLPQGGLRRFFSFSQHHTTPQRACARYPPVVIAHHVPSSPDHCAHFWSPSHQLPPVRPPAFSLPPPSALVLSIAPFFLSPPPSLPTLRHGHHLSCRRPQS